MRASRVIPVLFVLVSLAWTAPPDPDSTQASEPDRKIIAYYLYFNPRCETCLNMEAYSKDAVEKDLAAEVKSGRLEWHSLDIDKEEHKHFWDDFELETKALVIVEMKDGQQIRWKDCKAIWDLADNKPAFMKYVVSEIRSFLDSN